MGNNIGISNTTRDSDDTPTSTSTSTSTPTLSNNATISPSSSNDATSMNRKRKFLDEVSKLVPFDNDSDGLPSFASSTAKRARRQNFKRKPLIAKPWKCSNCKVACTTKEELQAHQLAKHHYQCNKCPQSFTKKTLLLSHSKLHKNQSPVVPKTKSSQGKCSKKLAPHKCSMCGEGFLQLKRYYTHCAKHLYEMSRPDAQKYECFRCEKSYAQLSSLVDHVSRHQAQKRFKCEGCPKYFQCNIAKWEHMRRLHPCKCNVCLRKASLGVRKSRGDKTSTDCKKRLQDFLLSTQIAIEMFLQHYNLNKNNDDGDDRAGNVDDDRADDDGDGDNRANDDYDSEDSSDDEYDDESSSGDENDGEDSSDGDVDDRADDGGDSWAPHVDEGRADGNIESNHPLQVVSTIPFQEADFEKLSLPESLPEPMADIKRPVIEAIDLESELSKVESSSDDTELPEDSLPVDDSMLLKIFNQDREQLETALIDTFLPYLEPSLK